MNEEDHGLTGKQGRVQFVTADSISLWELVTRYGTKGPDHLQRPSYQREAGIWSDDKKQSFYRTILSVNDQPSGKDHLGGAIVIYSTIKEPSVLKINDGLQRTECAAQFYREYENRGQGIIAIGILKRIKVTIQEFIYPNDDTAIFKFIQLNMGTGLTSKETGKPILYLVLGSDDCEQIWYPRIFGPLENRLPQIYRSYDMKAKEERIQNHKYTRDMYGLLYRFISGDKEISDYQTGQGNIDTKFQDEELVKDVIEYKLASRLRKIGIVKAEEELSKFLTFIDNEIALHKHIYNSVDKKEWLKINRDSRGQTVKTAIDTPTASHIHWFLAMAIYRRNNELPRRIFHEFVTQYIINTKGGTTVEGLREIDGDTQKYPFKEIIKLSNLQNLGQIQYILGVELNPNLEKFRRHRRTRRDVSRLKRGHSASHTKPFAIYGEGDTISTPLVQNISQGLLPSEVLYGREKAFFDSNTKNASDNKDFFQDLAEKSPASVIQDILKPRRKKRSQNNKKY